MLVIITGFIFFMKNVTCTIAVCVLCEEFYIAVEEVETVCVQRLTDTSYSGTIYF